MQKILVLKGCPGSGKSFYCRDLMNKEPGQWKRINNDDLRSAIDLGVYSPENEKIIRNTREFLIKEFIIKGYNILHDNVNATTRNFDDICKVVKTLNLDVMVIEKPFYVELEEAIERDSRREGRAKVGEAIVKKWHKELGGTQFKHYHPKVETFNKRTRAIDKIVEPMVQDESKDRAIICDLDGTLAKIGSRSPYSAENCDVVDSLNEYVAETVKLYYDAGHTVIFCSGRSEKDRAPTMRFIEKHLPGMEYVLLMRKDADFRKDNVVKEEIFNEYIKNKYWVKLVIDDRLSVCQLWFRLGLNLLRAGDPDANF